MARTRAFVLVLLISIGVLSYISFDSYIKPIVIGVPQPPPTPVPVHNDDSTTPPPTILLVSAFFPLSKSKHSISDYKAWLSRFLQPITTPIYFFTTPDMAPLIQSLRGDLPITINTTYLSPFDIPPLKDSPATDEGYDIRDKYQQMWSWDREKHRHNPELYAIWTAKPYFLDEGLRNSDIAYDYAFWTDAGSFRDPHSYTLWPDPKRVREVWEEGSKGSGTREEDLLFFPMWGPPHPSMQYWSEGMGPIDNEFSEGSFFGGTPHTIKWWRSLYFTYHDRYLSLGIFVGKDQTLINALFLLNPRRIISVWLGDPTPPSPPNPSALDDKRIHSRGLFGSSESNTPLGACGSTWYYYQFFFASESERESMRGRWGSGSGFGLSWGRFRFWSWDWWTGKTNTNADTSQTDDGMCRLTRVVAMESLLKRVFGEGWTAPASSL